jgi:radical SAM protein with 4Fe4S-binding SPASM domain
MPLPTIHHQTHPQFQKAQENFEARYQSGLSVQWHITNACNWRCTHCYHDTYQSPQPDLGTMKDIFHQFLEIGKTQNFSREEMQLKITGGEPFVHPDFLDFLAYTQKYADQFQLAILTNGSLITPEKVKFLRDETPLERIQISIDGDREANDKIRGEGTFDQILKAVEIIKSFDYPLHLGCTVSRTNYQTIWNLLDLLIIYDIPLLLRSLVPIGQSQEDLGNMLSPEEWKNFYAKARKLNQKYHLKRNQNRPYSLLGDQDQIFRFHCMGGVEAQSYSGKIKSCGVRRRNILSILPTGDVLACRLLPQFPLGNLKNKTLSELYSGPKYDALTGIDSLDPECKNCSVVDRCFGGAMCESEAVYQEKNKKDPQCWK